MQRLLSPAENWVSKRRWKSDSDGSPMVLRPSSSFFLTIHLFAHAHRLLLSFLFLSLPLSPLSTLSTCRTLSSPSLLLSLYCPLKGQSQPHFPFPSPTVAPFSRPSLETALKAQWRRRRWRRFRSLLPRTSLPAQWTTAATKNNIALAPSRSPLSPLLLSLIPLLSLSPPPSARPPKADPIIGPFSLSPFINPPFSLPLSPPLTAAIAACPAAPFPSPPLAPFCPRSSPPSSSFPLAGGRAAAPSARASPCSSAVSALHTADDREGGKRTLLCFFSSSRLVFRPPLSPPRHSRRPHPQSLSR